MPPYDQDDDQDEMCHWYNPGPLYGVYVPPPRCIGCNYFLAVDDGLCQYCEQEIHEDTAAMFAGFEKLLTAHMNFARWEDEQRASAA